MTKRTATEHVSALDQVKRRNNSKVIVLASLAAAAYRIRQHQKDIVAWDMLYLAKAEYMAEVKRLNAELAIEIFDKISQAPI